MRIKYVLETNFVILRPDETPKSRQHDIIHSKRNIFPIVSHDGKFIGLVNSEYLFSILLGELEGLESTFEKLAQKPNDIVLINENMESVMNKMNKEDTEGERSIVESCIIAGSDLATPALISRQLVT